MESIFTGNLIALVTLAALEIVLGIDNIVFISILAAKLPEERRSAARRVGLLVALGTRILLLLGLSWVMSLTADLFSVAGNAISGRDLILLAGGLFLIGKATVEIHDKLEGAEEHERRPRAAASFGSIIAQIAVIDIVFSLDSVITAIGMAQALWVMIVAVILAVLVMLAFANAIGGFIERHPTIKVLALAFMIMIGVLLVIEGLGKHVDKGYVYFAMAFSLGIELLNMRMRKKSEPVRLRQSYVTTPAAK